MKKQIKPKIKAHLIPSLFILLSLLTIGVIPFAMAQRNATKQPATKQVKIAANAAASTMLSGARIAARPAVTGHSGVPFRIGAPPAPKAPNVVLYDQYNNGTTTAT